MTGIQVPIHCKCPKCQETGWNVFVVAERPDGTLIRRIWCKVCGFEWREWPDPAPGEETIDN